MGCGSHRGPCIGKWDHLFFALFNVHTPRPADFKEYSGAQHFPLLPLWQDQACGEEMSGLRQAVKHLKSSTVSSLPKHFLLVPAQGSGLERCEASLNILMIFLRKRKGPKLGGIKMYLQSLNPSPILRTAIFIQPYHTALLLFVCSLLPSFLSFCKAPILHTVSKLSTMEVALYILSPLHALY